MSGPAAQTAAKQWRIDTTKPFQDPYALWAVQTDFRAFKRNQATLPSELTFLVELNCPYDPKRDFIDFSVGQNSGARTIVIDGVDLLVPLAYERKLPHTNRTATFITLRLPVKDKTVADKLKVVVMKLVNSSSVRRLQLGFQRPGYRYSAQSVDLEIGMGSGIEPLKTPPKVVLGIVEDSCPFGHNAVLDQGKTRVVALWDQSLVPPPVAPWSAPADFPYGQNLGQPAMNALIAQCRAPDGSLDEEALYSDPRVAMPELARRSSHGAAVMTLLASQPTVLGLTTPAQEQVVVLTKPQKDADLPVQLAPLVVVRLPREQTLISAGRWLSVNAIDALHCIIGVARQLAPADPPPKLVVNLSYGAIAGPHDHTSMAESAIDELCRGYLNLAVVVAAGNAHGTLRDTESCDPGACLPGGVHAAAPLPPGGHTCLTLLLPADKPFETYLELWFSDPGKGACDDQWLEDGEVDIEVCDPQGKVWLSAGSGWQDYQPTNGQDSAAGLVFARKASQSRHRSMALLVLAATRLHPPFVVAPAGRWTITVTNFGERTLALQAWVERDDTLFGIDRPQSARLVPGDDAAAAQLTDSNVFSSLASGRCTLSAGALVESQDSRVDCLASAYTSAGPADACGPTLSVVADAGVALSGMRVAGSHSGMVLRGNGTSLAAPQAARYIANRLADPRESLAHILATLPNTPRDARRGPKVA